MMKILKLFCAISVLLLYYSCGKAQTKHDSNSVDKNDVSLTNKTFVKTVKNSNRLTDRALSSFLPKNFLGQKFNGKTYSKTSEPDAYHKGIKHDFIQFYGEAGDITIGITDYSDSQGRINLMKKYGKTEDSAEHAHGSFKTYKDASGLYISEYLSEYEEKLNEGSVVVSNPRFDIIVESGKKRGKAYRPEVLLKELKKTNLFKLFDLPIPEGESSNSLTEESNKKILNCDELLPMSVIKTICNKSVGVKTTSFEKKYNCNRFYPDENSTGSLIFMVTQYERAPTAKSAVKIDKGKEIPNLGDFAVYIKEKRGDEYLKVNYKNYLLELRSTKNFDKEGVCYTEKELVKLMKGVMNRLQ